MDKFKQCLRICKGNLKRILKNPRLYLALSWFVMTSLFYLIQVRHLAVSLEQSVSAWIFPLLIVLSGNQMFVILGAVLLFCDAPFLYDNSGWQILRAGRRGWFWGNILYIWILAFIYAVFIAVLPMLFLIPHISFRNEWGALLGSLAQTSLADQAGITPLSYGLMVRYEPVEAIVLTVLAVWLNGVLVGVINYAANLLIRQGVGPIFCVAMGVTPVLTEGLQTEIAQVSMYFSPPSWMNLMNYNWDGYGTNPSPEYIYLAFAVMIAVGIAAGRIGIVRKDLQMMQDM